MYDRLSLSASHRPRFPSSTAHLSVSPSISNSTKSECFASPSYSYFSPLLPIPNPASSMVINTLKCSKSENEMSKIILNPPLSAFNKCIRHCAGCQDYMLLVTCQVLKIPPVQTHISIPSFPFLTQSPILSHMDHCDKMLKLISKSSISVPTSISLSYTAAHYLSQAGDLATQLLKSLQ